MERFEKAVERLELCVEYGTGWDPFGRSAEEIRIVETMSCNQTREEILSYFREMAEIVCLFEEALAHKDNLLQLEKHFHAMHLAKIKVEKLTR